MFFPRYFEIFDACTAHLFAHALGMRKSQFQKHYDIVGIPLLDAHCKFHIPTTYGDAVRVETQVTEVRRSSFSVEHRLFKDGQLCVEGFEKRVWAGRHPDDPGRMKGDARAGGRDRQARGAGMRLFGGEPVQQAQELRAAAGADAVIEAMVVLLDERFGARQQRGRRAP